MKEYIGLDVSMKETAVSIRRDGERIWRGKCVSDPAVIAQLVRKRAPGVDRIVFETGPLSVWFYHALRAEGLPAICIDARHAKSALDMAPNKTDANDADGLAHLAEIGFFREVRVKGFDSMLARTLIAARNRLVRITVDLSNHIRGFMKTFGLLIPAGKGSTFEAHVRRLLSDQPKRTWGLKLRERIGFKRAASCGDQRVDREDHTAPANVRWHSSTNTCADYRWLSAPQRKKGLAKCDAIRRPPCPSRRP